MQLTNWHSTRINRCLRLAVKPFDQDAVLQTQFESILSSLVRLWRNRPQKHLLKTTLLANGSVLMGSHIFATQYSMNQLFWRPRRLYYKGILDESTSEWIPTKIVLGNISMTDNDKVFSQSFVAGKRYSLGF